MKVTLRAKLCVFFLLCICIFIFSSCEAAPSGQAGASPTPSIVSVTKPPIATPDISAPIVTLSITAAATPEIQNKIIDFKNKIIISEICAKNSAGIRSASGGFYDWIEISNISSEPIPLIDLYITNDESTPQKFKLPEILLAPGKCLLLFASASENPQSGEIHLPFKLSPEGETITLYTKDSVFVDRVVYENLAPDSVLYKNRSGDMMRETFYATLGMHKNIPRR